MSILVSFNDSNATHPFSPQDLIKKLEKTVNQLIEESAKASAMGDYQTVRSDSVCAFDS